MSRRVTTKREETEETTPTILGEVLEMYNTLNQCTIFGIVNIFS